MTPQLNDKLNDNTVVLDYLPPRGTVGAESEVSCAKSPELSKLLLIFNPRSGELRTQKLKSHLWRKQSLKLLLLKPGVGQYIATPATITARDFFLANFYPSGPFTCIFSSKHSRVFPVVAVANSGSCVGLQNKIDHPPGCRFLCGI